MCDQLTHAVAVDLGHAADDREHQQRGAAQKAPEVAEPDLAAVVGPLGLKEPPFLTSTEVVGIRRRVSSKCWESHWESAAARPRISVFALSVGTARADRVTTHYLPSALRHGQFGRVSHLCLLEFSLDA